MQRCPCVGVSACDAARMCFFFLINFVTKYERAEIERKAEREREEEEDREK